MDTDGYEGETLHSTGEVQLDLTADGKLFVFKHDPDTPYVPGGLRSTKPIDIEIVYPNDYDPNHIYPTE